MMCPGANKTHRGRTVVTNLRGTSRSSHAELKKQGIAAGIYTRTRDVEGEINGLITYDRTRCDNPLVRSPVSAQTEAMQKPPESQASASASTACLPPAPPAVGPWGPAPLRLNRRSLFQSAVAGAAALALPPGSSSVLATPDDRRAAPKRHSMKKSINLWAFPYPERMNLEECLRLAKKAGFDGIELNYDLDNDLSPKSGTAEYVALRKLADRVGIEISGLCSFLFWPYPLTSNDPAKRTRGLELAGLIAQAAHDLGVKNVLVVPGAVHIPWRTDHDPVPNDVCDRRAREAVAVLAQQAEKLDVVLNMENIFFNGYLMTPMEMNQFVDSFQSPHVRVHFDTGNIAMFQHAEHWVPILGKRIRNVHLKEFTKKGTDFSLEAFRPLLDGTTNWPALMAAFDAIGYDGFLTFEYFHPYAHYPEALIYQTADSLDRILGLKQA